MGTIEYLNNNNLKNLKLVYITSLENKFLYTKIPKNAGSSLYRMVMLKHISDTALRNLDGIVEKDLDDYFKFTIVRNPYDRVVSLWSYFTKMVSGPKGIKACSFKEFLKNDYMYSNECIARHANEQYPHIIRDDGVQYIDNIFKLEEIEYGWPIIAKNIGVSNIKRLPVFKNKSNHKGYSMYYDEWCIEKVSEIYKRDLELLDYEF